MRKWWRVVCLSCTDEGAHHDHQRNTKIGQHKKIASEQDEHQFGRAATRMSSSVR